MTSDNERRDGGFTLIEAVISIALMSVLASVISAAIVVTLRASPGVEDRADAAVNVQGLVTWLPQDVDSAAPGSFDKDQAATTGCTGADPGFNLLKVTWSETIGSTTDYVASYRYVTQPDGGHIVRVYCVVGSPQQVLKVTGLIPAWVTGSEPVRIDLSDSPADADTLVDSAKFSIEPVVGKTIVIDATTKNPNETLPPPTTSPTPTTSAPPANQAPVAAVTNATVVGGTPVTVMLAASDPEGAALTVAVAPVPLGWSISVGAGASIIVDAPITAVGTSEVLTYTVTDPAGASASAPVTITVSAPGPQPPIANPASASTDAGSSVGVALPASDPEDGAMTATFSGVPADWTATAVGLVATITPPGSAAIGDYTIGYTVTDPGGLTGSSTITVSVTAPPPCVITPPALSQSSVKLKKKPGPDSLAEEVDVRINVVGGYCVGLALHYDTGAPNGQYVRNFGNSGSTRTVTLPKHPSAELWAAGPHTLDVKDGSSTVIGTATLTVTT